MTGMQDLRPGAGSAISQTERVILALRELVLRGEFRAGERLAELTVDYDLEASALLYLKQSTSSYTRVRPQAA